LVKVTEMAYAVPLTHGRECLEEVLDLIEQENLPVNLPIEYRFVAGDDIYLSPFYKQASALIDIHMFRGANDPEPRYTLYFRKAEEIFKKYHGRPHWGKVHYQTAKELRALYPEWDRFQEVRRRLDPHGRFTNGYLETILGKLDERSDSP
jgi:FAD/FMN-containing dehydrogenase